MTDYKLISTELTPEMIESATEAFHLSSSISSIVRAALAVAPDVQVEPLGYVVPRMAARLGKGELCGISVLDQPEDGHTLPVYLGPQPAEQQPEPDVAGLESALKSMVSGYMRLLQSGYDRITDLGGDCDPVDVMERDDAYLREARAALAAHRKQGGES